MNAETDVETIRREAKARVVATQTHPLVGGRVVVRDPALLASIAALLAEDGRAAALGAPPSVAMGAAPAPAGGARAV